MSDDLHRRLSGLATLTPPTPFDAPGAVRDRGHRRARRQGVATAVAAVVALGLAAAVGTPLIGGAPRSGFTGPGVTPGPTAPVTVFTFTEPPDDPRLTELLFLTVADIGPEYKVRTRSYPGPVLREGDNGDLQCRDPLPNQYPAQRHLSGTRQMAYYQTDVAVGYPVTQTIRRYEPGWAPVAMADLDAAVPRCSEESGLYNYRTVETGFAGDESRLIAVTLDNGDKLQYYLTVVRVGDHVTSIAPEKIIDAAVARRLATAAAVRLAAG